jgi:hypothetical protein
MDKGNLEKNTANSMIIVKYHREDIPLLPSTALRLSRKRKIEKDKEYLKR